MAEGKFTKVGAFWIKEKNGRKYFSGKLDKTLPAGTQIFVYKNDHKKEDKHPDYTLNAIIEEDYVQEEPPTEENQDIPF